MEDLSTALFYDTVPDPWVARAYPSMMGLAAWYADLLLRIRVRTVSLGPSADPRPRGQDGGCEGGSVCSRQRPRGPHGPGLCQSRAGRAWPTPHRRLTIQALPAGGREQRPHTLPARAQSPRGTRQGSRLVKASFGTPNCPQMCSPSPDPPLPLPSFKLEPVGTRLC